MKLQNTTAEHQMASPLIAAALIISLIFSFIFGFGFSSVFVTSLLLIASTLLFTLFTKQKPVTDQETIHQETSSMQQQPDETEAVKPQNEKVQELREADDEEQQIQQDYSIKTSSQDFLSESDQSLNHLSSSEESEVEWPFRDIVYQSPDCSDASISDEETDLIEISLPSGHSVGHYNKEEAPNNKFHLPVPDFSTPSIHLKQHGLMELLAAEINDMNEEDNLIEIDISMGSIKCPRFEIEA